METLASAEPSQTLSTTTRNDSVTETPNHIYQNPARLRGASVDRYREYLSPQYYEDTYYREDNDRRVTVKHIGFPTPGSEPYESQSYYEGQGPYEGRLERQWSHPNLRPRPHLGSAGGSASACGRRLPKTPSQPPGTIIVIENVLPAGQPAGSDAVSKPSAKKQLPARPTAPSALERSGSSAAVAAGGVWSTSTATAAQRRSCSLPRKGANPVRERPQGTGRRLPPTPKQTQVALPLKNAPNTRPKRELPKPQSLELRHSNHDFMNSSNAVLGLVKSDPNNKSVNFPKLDGSPTHSECSSGSPAPPRHTSGRRRQHGYHRRRNADY